MISSFAEPIAMATVSTETSRLLTGPSNRQSYLAKPSVNRCDSEAESSLSTTPDSSSVYCRRAAHRDTIYDLHELLEALDNARNAIQAQVDAHVATHARRRPKPLIPHWITKYLLIITFLGQTITIGLIEVIEQVDKKTGTNATNSKVDLVGNILLTVLQSMHLLLVFFVSFKVVKQVIHHTASGSLVAQSYLSTVLLFAGLYTVIYRFDPHGWKRVSETSVPSPIVLFLRMLFFSVSTATLCGTSVIEPVKWYTIIVVGIQMLTSFVYFTSIMSVALTPRRRSQFEPPSNTTTTRSFTRKIRRFVFGGRNNAKTYTL